MKYAELKRQAREAIQRAEESEARALEAERIATLDSLKRRGDRVGCDHFTARKPWQPCPHPDCSGHIPDVRYYAMLPAPSVATADTPINKPVAFNLRRTKWTDGRTRTVTWAWENEA